MIQLDDALSPFLVTLNAYHQNVTYDVDNRPVYGAETPFLTTGSIQEVTNKELKMVPEGEYTENTKVWYSKDDLLFSQDDNVLSGDQIEFNNNRYKIVAKGDWTVYGYQVYLIVKLDPDL